MAVFATNIERPVRISDTAASGLLRHCRSAGKGCPKQIHQ
jgi:hypothetical protein